MSSSRSLDRPRPRPRPRPRRARRRGAPSAGPVRRGIAAATALLVALATGGVGCRRGALPPTPGDRSYQAPGWLVWQGPGTPRVNLAGGNLLVRRVELSLDTRVLAPFEIAATWNGSERRWRHSFEMRFDGDLLVDDGGARWTVSDLQPPAVVPGSRWIVLGPSSVRSLGGVVYEFHADGALAALRLSVGDWPRLELRRSDGRVTAVDQCLAPGDCTRLLELAWEDGHLASLQDLAGRRAELTWEQGRLVAARDGLDVARGWAGFRYAYDGDGALRSIRNSEGESVTIDYSGRRVARLTGGGPEPESVELVHGRQPADAGGRFWTRVLDMRGGDSFLYFDGDGRLLERVSPMGRREQLAWDGRLPTEMRDAAGLVTRLEHPEPDRIVLTTPTGNRVVTRFAPVGGPHRNDRDPWSRPVLSQWDSLGTLREVQYDAQGRRVRDVDGEGIGVALAWHPDHTLAEVRDGDGFLRARFSEPGHHGHATRVELPSGHVEEREIDLVGNQLSVDPFSSDPSTPGVIARRYDADRNVSALVVGDLPSGALTSAEVGVVEVDWRSDHRRAAVRRPYGGDSEFVYDARGRLAARRERVDGSWQTTSFEVAPDGSWARTLRPNGTGRRVAFDADGRVSEVALLRDGAVEQRATYAYDEAGRLIARSDDAYGGGVEQLYYDAAGRPAGIVHPGGESVLRSFDLRGRPVREEFSAPGLPLFRRLSFAWDAANRVVQVRDGDELVLEREYAGPRLLRVAYGNGLETTRTFHDDPEEPEPSGALEGSETRRRSTGELVADVLHRTRPGCALGLVVCQKLRTRSWGPGGEPLADWNETFWLYPGPLAGGEHGPTGTRLAGWGPVFEDELRELTHLYQYDLVGNLEVDSRRPGDPALEDYVWNAERNRLLEGFGHTYAYDAAGFAVRRDGVPISWTADGRLARIGDQVSFTWDVEGRPVSRTVDGETTRFLFGGRGLGDAEGSPLALVVDPALVIPAHGDERRYRHFDERGNVRFVSDASGEVVQHFHYSGYRVEETAGSTPDHDAGFAQGRSLGDTGLVWLGARIYDPDVGRFLSPDPVFKTLEQYTYAAGNPVWLWDPDGRHPESTDGYSGVTIGIGTSAAGFALISGGYSLSQLAVALSGLGLTKFTTVLGVTAAGFAGAGVVLVVVGGATIVAFAASDVLISGGRDVGGPRNVAPSRRIPLPETSTISSGGPGGPPGGGDTSGSQPACAPRSLDALPAPDWLLGLLLLIQLGLGLFILRREMPR